MSMDGNEKTALALVSFAVIVTYAGQAINGNVSIRPALGGVLVAVVLTATAGPAPKLAVAMAAVILMTSLSKAGPDVISALAP